MAAYPTIGQGKSSKRVPISANKIDIASDGTLRARTDFSSNIYQFSIVHETITEAEKDSIESFYDTNASLNFTFTFDADLTVYECVFNNVPLSRWVGENVWLVTTTFTGAKQ